MLFWRGGIVVGIIEIDPLSLFVGYLAGTMLCWSLQKTLYGDSNDEQAEASDEDLYTSIRTGNDDVYICSPERRIM